MSSNSYSHQNGWHSSGVNMGMSAQPVNLQNIPCAPNFTNSSNHPPQNNFKPNQVPCPPYDVSRQTHSFNMYHAADTVHDKSVNHPYTQSSNHSQLGLGTNTNVAQEPTLESGYMKHIPPSSTCFSKQSTFDSCQPFVDTKSNFYSNGILNEAQPNVPMSNNCMPLQNPHAFQNFNSNFRHYPPSVPSQPSGNPPPYVPGLMYNVPPPIQSPGTNITNGPMNVGLPQQNGQFRFMPPSNQQFQMNFGSEASLACNPPNQQTFSNANMMLPPPTFCDPPPYPFHLQPTAMQVPPPATLVEGNAAPTVPDVSWKETKLTNFLQKFQVGKADKPKSDITVRNMYND